MPRSSKKTEPTDNLQAAMDKVVESTDLTITPDTGSEPGRPASAQVLIRTTEAERDRWKLAAEASGKSLTEFARELLSGAAAEVLDCQHPLNQRRYYPWAEFCLRCGIRLRG